MFMPPPLERVERAHTGSVSGAEFATRHEHLPEERIAPSGRIPEECPQVAESPRRQKPEPGSRFASTQEAACR